MTVIATKFKSITDEELVKKLRAVMESPTQANGFWGSFNYLPNLLYGNYSNAQRSLLLLLHQCQSLDPEAYLKTHKGTPFYWLGVSAFLQHDYQTATFFLDAAVSEDLRINANPIHNPTPAMFFITLQGNQLEQAAQELVQVTQSKTQRALDIYNAMLGRLRTANFTIDDLQQKFLIPALTPGRTGWRTLTTTLISFIIEWDYRNEFFDLRPEAGTAEPFYLQLFKGCVLFESLLKANPSQNVPLLGNLGSTLQDLHSALNIPHNLSIGNNSFPDVINSLQNVDNSIQTAIIFTGRVRNTVAHNFGWIANLGKIEYFRLYSMIVASCVHAIDCLY